MDYNLWIWIIFGVLLLIMIAVTLVNHYKKTKSKKKICIVCKGIGFTMSLYTDRPAPACQRCNGTGYVNKE